MFEKLGNYLLLRLRQLYIFFWPFDFADGKVSELLQKHGQHDFLKNLKKYINAF